MLDKILNITPGTDYNNSPSKKGHKEFLFHRNLVPNELHDRMSLSPAWVFLSQLNWHIIGIKMPREDRLSLTFLINEIEFHIEIDLNDLSNKSPFIYNISQRKSFNNIEKVSSIVLEKKLVSRVKINPIQEYRGILKLFERVWNLNLNYELNDEECYLNTLLDEIYEEINAEMEFITQSLVTFIEKLMNKTFSYISLSKGEILMKEGKKYMEIKVKNVKSSDNPLSSTNA